jgi:hypothetical protein
LLGRRIWRVILVRLLKLVSGLPRSGTLAFAGHMLSPTISKATWEGTDDQQPFKLVSLFSGLILLLRSWLRSQLQCPVASWCFPIRRSLCDFCIFPSSPYQGSYLSNNKSSLTPLRFLYLWFILRLPISSKPTLEPFLIN